MRHVRAIILSKDKLVVMHRNKFGKEYYTLIGGGIDAGEDNIHALLREIAEETGIQVANPRLVITEDDDKFYGPQDIYLCDYISGEPVLAPDSTEHKINQLGKNLYTPMWLPIAELANVAFVSPQLQKALTEYLPKGFPDRPIMLN